MFDANTPTFYPSDPRPRPRAPAPYQSNDVSAGPWLRLNNHGSADTPRNRFDYAVELRQHQQFHEWSVSQIKKSMLGDTESQNKVARKWVIDQWQRWGIWKREWPEDGPGSEERWGDGHPACLLAMELTWEIEHLVTIQQPVDVSRICDTEAPQSPDTPPLDWSWELVAALAAEQLFNRHRQDGFPSTKIELPSVVFRQDLKSLSVNLPEPVQKLMATVENWDDLSLPLELQPERRDIFGDPIRKTHREASTLEAAGARNSGNEQGRGLFGTTYREASPLEAAGARNSGNGRGRGLFGTTCREASPLEAGGARNSGNEQGRGLFGTTYREASPLEAGGARNSGNEQGRGLFGTTYRETSPLKDGVFLTETGRAFFDISEQEAGEIPSIIGRSVVLSRLNAHHEEEVRTSSRQIEGARNSGNEEAVRTSGRQVGGARNADIAEIVGSIRAMRGSRRREPRREPGKRTVRLTQGGRVKKASKQARP